MTTDWQFTYGGFTWGAGTSIEAKQVTGLVDLPNLRTFAVERDGRQGVFAASWFANTRIVQMLVDVTATPTQSVAQQSQTLYGALGNLTAPAPLVWKIPGWQQQQIYCRPTKVQIPMDVAFDKGIGTFALEFVAEDPRIYGVGAFTTGAPSDVGYQYQHQASIGTLVTGGLTFPITFPITFGASSGGTAVAANGGTHAANPVISIAGPVTNPSIVNQTTGQTMTFTGTVNTNQALLIDVRSRQVWLATMNPSTSTTTYASATYLLASGTTWLTLQPGNNTLALFPAGAPGATVWWSDTFLMGGTS